MGNPLLQSETKDTAIRQLAAIMFADMTGYTAMMQDDEQKAKTLHSRQKKAIDTHIPGNKGKIIQYFGDGTLSIFDSSIDAIKAGIEIQRELLQEPKVLLRIGIHSGEVVLDKDGLYGDCVNVASRIETLSVPGSVFISDKVHDEIKNHKEIKVKSMGRFSLKNVKRQIDVYAIANDGLIVPDTVHLDAKVGSEKSIAVLPFVNMSNDAENEYFSDGISEEILNALTQVEGIRVTSRTSSFSFKGKQEDVRQIGIKLGVSAILEGSVRKAGNKVRITAQLINTADGYHIWSEVFDGDLDDIFKVQDEISLKILNRLKENFAPVQNHDPIIKPATKNIDAYNIYLKGMYHWNKSKPEDIKIAVKTFQEAIQKDPQFADAYCALSYCYSFLGSAGLMEPAEAFTNAKNYTLKAIEIDPNHANAHLTLATISFFHNWDFDAAEASIQKAISLNLNSSFINQIHGWLLITKGDFEKAIEKMKQALLLDPISLPLLANLADAYSFAGKFEEAIAHYDKAIELDPAFRRAFEGKGMVYLAKNDYDKAIYYFEKYHKLIGDPLKGLASLGHAYAAAGNKEKTFEILEKIKEREKRDSGIPMDMDYAFVYAGMKDFEKSFHYLNKTYENRIGIACLGMIFCVRYPMMNEMKADPRFKELTGKMDL
jgi:TolB-like protein/class 3 adenylate cyclase/Tfp pilus assembly protein PilF